MAFSKIDMNATAFTVGDRIFTNLDVYEIATKSENLSDMILDIADGILDLEDPLAVADSIANAFKPYMAVMVDSEWWYYQEKYCTILDSLQDMEPCNNEVEIWMMLRAFKRAGFKPASEYTDFEIRQALALRESGPYAFKPQSVPKPATHSPSLVELGNIILENRNDNESVGQTLQRLLFDNQTDIGTQTGQLFIREVQNIQMRTLYPAYKYEYIKQDREVLHQDLIKYLHRPDRIAKWLEAGNDLEDYLP